jgi:hypothetical protein
LENLFEVGCQPRKILKEHGVHFGPGVEIWPLWRGGRRHAGWWTGWARQRSRRAFQSDCADLGVVIFFYEHCKFSRMINECNQQAFVSNNERATRIAIFATSQHPSLPQYPLEVLDIASIPAVYQ